MWKKIVVSIVGSALAASCATVPPSRYPVIDLEVMGQSTPAELASRLADENDTLTPTPFRSSDGVLSGRVLAAGAVEAAQAIQGYVVTVGLGTAEPLRCTVQEGVLGLSAFARTLAQAYLASYAAHELKYAFAGTNGSLPYLVVHGQYIDQGGAGEGRKTGFLKLVVAGRAELTVACFHDQFGYRETVERVALSLIETLSWVDDKPLRPLVRRSVYALRKGAAAVGAREVVIRADEEDFRRSWVRTSFLSVRGPQRLYARDVLETFDSDPDGRVYAQTYQAEEDGTKRVELTVKERPMSDYEVSGTIDEQDTDVRFSAPKGIPDLLQTAAYVRAEKSFARFMPEISPRDLTPSDVKKSETGVRVTSGDRVVTGQLDAMGYWVSGTRSDGYSFERTALEP